MKKEIRVVNKEKQIVQITCVDERFYAKSIDDPVTGLPTYAYVPSVTWICNFYPKGVGYAKWLAEHGFDEAEAIKQAAADKGSKVHSAIARLLSGENIQMDEVVVNPSTGQSEPLSLEEYQAIMSFVAWHTATKPVLVSADQVIWNDADEYAGSVDFVCTIDGQLYVVDFKTSKAIWPGHRMQVSAYKHAVPEWKDAKLAILQLGYAKNRMGYKFTEVEDCYPLFQAARVIWKEETHGQTPLQRDYPLSVRLAQPKEAPCAPSGADGKITNVSPPTNGSPEPLRKSSTTSSGNTTSKTKKLASGARP